MYIKPHDSYQTLLMYGAIDMREYKYQDMKAIDKLSLLFKLNDKIIHTYTYMQTHKYIYIYTYIYICKYKTRRKY